MSNSFSHSKSRYVTKNQGDVVAQDYGLNSQQKSKSYFTNSKISSCVLNLNLIPNLTANLLRILLLFHLIKILHIMKMLKIMILRIMILRYYWRIR